MFSLDEDDDLPSSSSAEALTRADHGRHEHQERKAAAKGKLLQLQRDTLRGQVKAKKTEKDEAPKPDESAVSVEKSATKDFAPKTISQQAKEQVQTAQKVQTAEQLLQDAKRAAAAEKAAGEEYQSDLG